MKTKELVLFTYWFVCGVWWSRSNRAPRITNYIKQTILSFGAFPSPPSVINTLSKLRMIYTLHLKFNKLPPSQTGMFPGALNNGLPLKTVFGSGSPSLSSAAELASINMLEWCSGYFAAWSKYMWTSKLIGVKRSLLRLSDSIETDLCSVTQINYCRCIWLRVRILHVCKGII